MKQKIHQLHPELEYTPNTAASKELLTKAAKEAWHSLEDSILVRLSKIMLSHVRTGRWVIYKVLDQQNSWAVGVSNTWLISAKFPVKASFWFSGSLEISLSIRKDYMIRLSGSLPVFLFCHSQLRVIYKILFFTDDYFFCFGSPFKSYLFIRFLAKNLERGNHYITACFYCLLSLCCIRYLF